MSPRLLPDTIAWRMKLNARRYAEYRWAQEEEARRKAKQKREEEEAALAAERAALRALPKTPRCKVTRNEWFAERAARDPGFRLNRNFRHAVNQSLRGAKKGRKWQTLVGYSLADLRAHLEAQFVDGMAWENIGEWHVDHIRPLASFQIESAECADFKAAWALSNLRPLWAKDNLRKGARWAR